MSISTTLTDGKSATLGRSISMLEMNELSIIRDMQDDLDAIQRSDYDISTECTSMEADRSDHTSENTDAGTETSSKASTGAGTSTEAETNSIAPLPTFHEDHASKKGMGFRRSMTSTGVNMLGLIEEESTTCAVQGPSSPHDQDGEKNDNHQQSCKTITSRDRRNVMDLKMDMDIHMGVSMDLSSHSIQLNLDHPPPKRQTFLPSSFDDRSDESNDEEKSSLDLDISIHSLNLGLDLDGKSASTTQFGVMSSPKENSVWFLPKPSSPQEEKNVVLETDHKRNNNNLSISLELDPSIRHDSPSCVQEFKDGNNISSSHATNSQHPSKQEPQIPSPKKEYLNHNTTTPTSQITNATSINHKTTTSTTEKKPKLNFMKKSASMLSFLPSQKRSLYRRRSSKDKDCILDNSNELSLSKQSQQQQKPVSILRNSVSMIQLNDEEPTKGLSRTSSSSSSSSSITNPNQNTMKRVTSFSTIEIREYDITLGDNPGGQSGPPLSLDWNYNKHLTQIVPVDTYEETRPPRRMRTEMHMKSSIRSYILMREQGFSMTEVRKASKLAAEIRKKRDKTLNRIVQRDLLKEKVCKLFMRKSAVQ